MKPFLTLVAISVTVFLGSSTGVAYAQLAEASNQTITENQTIIDAINQTITENPTISGAINQTLANVNETGNETGNIVGGGRRK